MKFDLQPFMDVLEGTASWKTLIPKGLIPSKKSKSSKSSKSPKSAPGKSEGVASGAAMPFGMLRLFDTVAGKILFVAIVPLCLLVTRFVLTPRKRSPKNITILKLHGGGSLILAMPALLGIRNKYPQAVITLIGTPETRPFAELTGIFNEYVLIRTHSFVTLAMDSLKALMACRQHDMLIDLEPHSALAPVFTAMTFASRRYGFVKAGESYRAHAYTNPVYFNVAAPIQTFYEQIALILGAPPAAIELCQINLKAQADASEPLLKSEHPRPAVYISAFTSSLSPERMMPVGLWIEQLKKKFGSDPITLVIGGGKEDAVAANSFATKVKAEIPLISILSTCGTRNFKQTVDDINQANEFWGIDSGPLHIARLLGKTCTSFWGPSNPTFRLQAIPGLEEQIHYRSFPCSPCVHLSAASPCKGDNQCMKQLFTEELPPPIQRF